MVGGVQDRKGKRLFIEGDTEEEGGGNHTLTCILCSLAKGKSFLKFGCLAEASQWKYCFHTSFKSDRNTAKSRHDKNPVHAGCGYSFSGSQISSGISFSRMSLGVTGAVDYPQQEAAQSQRYIVSGCFSARVEPVFYPKFPQHTVASSHCC